VKLDERVVEVFRRGVGGRKRGGLPNDAVIDDERRGHPVGEIDADIVGHGCSA
jgi:hypothetical protein